MTNIIIILVGALLVLIFFFPEKINFWKKKKKNNSTTKKADEHKDHDHDHGNTHSKMSVWGKIWNALGYAVVISVIILLFWGFFVMKSSCSRTPEQTTSTPTEPTYFELTTPCTFTADYEFFLESEGESIAQKFPGISKTVTYTGKGHYDIPYGRKTGPIKFWDPNDPENGRKKFRIYRVK